MTRRTVAFLLAAVCVALPALTPASASTGGTADTSNRYSNVAFLLYYEPDGLYSCSGALVTPTVVLTAAHCVESTVVGRIGVTFDALIDEQAPFDEPRAADPAVGYATADLVGTRYAVGTPHPHPGWTGNITRDLYDVGVVVLDQPVNLPLAPLAPRGRLDQIAKSQLSKTYFRSVGYGVAVAKYATAPRKPYVEDYPVIRRFVDMPGKGLSTQVLTTSGNPNDSKGTGGTCFGDSGGPIFLGTSIVGVASWVKSDKCRYQDGFQRVDSRDVRDWLAQFGVS